jgi:hypothetical protein
MEEEISESENHHEDEHMDTGKDPDPPEPPRLIVPTPAPPIKQTTRTETIEHTPSGGGYFPQTNTWKTCQRKKILPPVQPKMKEAKLKNLQGYN